MRRSDLGTSIARAAALAWASHAHLRDTRTTLLILVAMRRWDRAAIEADAIVARCS